MHEDEKIEEAQHFLAKLSAADHDKVRFEVSAFLTAARSALQYALDEAKTKPSGQSWYTRQVQADPVVAFLKDKRDVNIHERPVPVHTDMSVLVDGTSGVTSGTLTGVVIHGKTGERIEFHDDTLDGHVQATPRIVPKQTVAFRYAFRDWNGPEDVPTLCQRYLDEITRIVADGQKRGFLTK